LLTHIASALFWAVPFSLWLQRESERSAEEIMLRGTATAAIAATFDYLAVPRRLRRLTPE
jgi:hypothetical protein